MLVVATLFLQQEGTRHIMGTKLKLRPGYVFIDDKGKPVEGKTIFDSDDPMVQKQTWKFDPLPDSEQVADDEPLFDVTALATMTRGELMEMHEEKIGTPDEGITLSKLRTALRKHFSDLAHDNG